MIDKRPQLVVTPVLSIQRTLETTPQNKPVNFKENRNNQTQAIAKHNLQNGAVDTKNDLRSTAEMPKIELDEVLVDFEGRKPRVDEDEKKNLEYLQQKMTEQSL